jgi:hypothetical protein
VWLQFRKYLALDGGGKSAEGPMIAFRAALVSERLVMSSIKNDQTLAEASAASTEEIIAELSFTRTELVEGGAELTVRSRALEEREGSADAALATLSLRDLVRSLIDLLKGLARISEGFSMGWLKNRSRRWRITRPS